MTPVHVNARVLSVASNGQRRVAEEIIARLPSAIPVAPQGASSGVRGHLWEQGPLLLKTWDKRLWSPSTSGPVFHPNHIVTVHDIAFVDGREWFSSSFSTLYDQITRRLAGSARHLITVSEFTRQRLIEHYRAHPDRVTTIHSGVSPSFTPQPADAVAALRSRIGVDGPYLVAFLGSDPRKNTARVLEAWAQIHPRFPEARLVTFGRLANPRVFADAQASGAPMEGVVHAGPVSDAELASLYTGAAGLVFPSLYEGFGLPILEAAACGSSILTAATTAMPEISPPDAHLVDPRSVADIAAAMARLLEDADEPDARARRRDFASAFTWERTRDAYVATFEKHFA